ncbi:styrene monooxygenase/indole monooxygenase family protein [Nocardiopsis ansamitocini]|uniref:Alanine-phosphoribitol ligase n=1 Tax=Nocardiopsis ansamitocini TaxID=1670832 RepID=A0A9W6UH80_9ACTN|nr:styrene monooxygenase/indole monooxygenase family protein [Nocardiopsis ansamitocini]GLU46472.1 alanine-phosphoribitol ligase [Nocardiopsis ansamitocini]
MRKILIVGGGQSGLQLALGLLDDDYDVTLVTARTPDEIRGGRVLSTQCMFDTALQHERDLELNHWEDRAPKIEHLGISVAGPGNDRVIDWAGRTTAFAQSVDQRIKMAAWTEEFEAKGGHLTIAGATVSDLERFAVLFDLVVVGAGKGEIAQLFDRDARHSPYTVPQRALSAAYVNGMTPRAEHARNQTLHFNIIPGVGELFTFPALTLDGPCDILFLEGVPGGPLDVFDGLDDPYEHLRRALELVRSHVPWEYERCAAVELTDPGAVLAGRLTPVVRKPVGRLPGGRIVLGMADIVVANDPVTGQGANSAAKCAAAYHLAIVEHGDEPFDEAFMQAAFDSYWDKARHVTAWTNALLAPRPPHVLEILAAAGRHQEIADRFAADFDDPSRFATWFLDPVGAGAYLADVAARAGGSRAEPPR